MRPLVVALAFFVASCGARPENAGPPPIPGTSIPAPSIAPLAPPVASGPKPKPERLTPFPPAPVNPPVARTAAKGDGAWRPLSTGESSPSMYRTILHPNRIKPSVYVAVVAIDLERVGLELVAGTIEPPSAIIPIEKRPGLVQKADTPDLLAVFNGGFMARHGQLGMMVDGSTFLPPKDEACTIALYRAGATPPLPVRIATWTRLSTTQPTMRAYRQTPPCLLEDGAVHPDIDSEQRPRPWSASATGEYDVRRTALGLDVTGTILFFGLGEWVTPHDLADAMAAAGATVAAQLDINWSYTWFLLFGRPLPDGHLQVIDTLISKTKFRPDGYVETSAERDFFYLKRLHPPDSPE